MEESREKLRSFQEFLELDRPLTIQEAIKKLSDFHETSSKNVLDAFLNLKKFSENNDEGTVIFKKSINAGQECVIMEGRDKNDKWVWNHAIDKDTGQPLMRSH